MYENLAILAAFVFLYSLVSGGLEKTLSVIGHGISANPLVAALGARISRSVEQAESSP